MRLFRVLLAGVPAGLLMAAAAGCMPSHDGLSSARGATTSPALQGSRSAPAAVARGKVEVEGGLLDMRPSASGVVDEVMVKEGDTVQKGEVLLRLRGTELQSEVAVAQSEVQLAQARSKALADRLVPLTQTAGRWGAAVREGAADTQTADEAEQALRNAQAEAKVATAEVAVAQRKRDQLKALAARLELRAPEAGRVVRLMAREGVWASPDSVALVLLPARPLQVRAELNEAFLDSVHEGMTATVVADSGAADSAAMPRAKVIRISPVVGAARLQDDALRGPVRVVECVLAFEQPPEGVRVGQNVRVTFHE